MENLPIAAFEYDLPDDRIARFPLPERDQSKLLVYQQGTIRHTQFTSLPELLPAGSTLVFNNTRVIPARLHFQKITGAVIELFLLHPVQPSSVISVVMEEKHSCVWECMIGNRKRWKNGEVLTQEISVSGKSVRVAARLVEPEQSTVELSWSEEIPFAELVQTLGKIPLPPYLKREAEESDLTTYQTLYSEKKGAVAAPTAGLHFTERVFEELTIRGIAREFLTLHVGAGTFQPVKTANALEHTMHGEQLLITQENLQRLMASQTVVAVGTTSMRSLESMYWLGVWVIQNPQESLSNGFEVRQFVHQELIQETMPSFQEAYGAILQKMKDENQQEIIGETQIMIYPGYTFRVCRGLVTNFHQPGSTLMLLVAAFIGSQWQQVYAEALANEYRFLSYGDSSLLLP